MAPIQLKKVTKAVSVLKKENYPSSNEVSIHINKVCNK